MDKDTKAPKFSRRHYKQAELLGLGQCEQSNTLQK